MMTVTHGHSRYTRGCRCNVCVTAERQYQRDRYRRRHGLPVEPPESPALIVANADGPNEAGRVESAVQAELNSLHAATDRPGLAQIALALARILDNPTAVSNQPPAAKGLATLLDKLHSASPRWGRHGYLALVQTMTETGGG